MIDDPFLRLGNYPQARGTRPDDVIFRINDCLGRHQDAILDRGVTDGEWSPDVRQGGECCCHRAFSLCLFAEVPSPAVREREPNCSTKCASYTFTCALPVLAPLVSPPAPAASAHWLHP
jgi:hypothetical protein